MNKPWPQPPPGPNNPRMDTTQAPDLHPHIAAFYDEHYEEADRLHINAFGRLERERTKELLLRELPPAPAHILDVGGGPGVYAAWLASLGYTVTLIDPVARHREQAAEYATFTVEAGDARALSAADASADVVLMLGPLYHLPDAADRARALREANRVVKPGGLIAAAFISRHSPLLDLASKLRINDDAIADLLKPLSRNGTNDPETGFTVAYFHTVEEPLFPLLCSGLVEDRADYFEAALRAARLAEDYPDLLPTTAHLLAVTRRS